MIFYLDHAIKFNLLLERQYIEYFKLYREEVIYGKNILSMEHIEI